MPQHHGRVNQQLLHLPEGRNAAVTAGNGGVAWTGPG